MPFPELLRYLTHPNENCLTILLFSQTSGILPSFGFSVEELLTKKLTRAHKRALRILLRDYDTPFDELFIRNDEKTIHVLNLQQLMIEVNKSFNYQNYSFLWDVFTGKEISYNLRIKDIQILPKTSTASLGTNSITLKGSILWNNTT